MRKGHQVNRGARVVAFILGSALLHGQTPAADDVVGSVRTAMANGGLVAGEKALADYRAMHGATPDSIDALIWLARGALSAQQYDKANQYASEGRRLAQAALNGARDQRDWNAFGQSVEVLALILTAQGGRSDAIHLLRTELAANPSASVRDMLDNTIKLLTLEGKPAPAFESGTSLGPRIAAGSKRQPTLVFFWAHWCQECKAESPMIGRLADKYRERGLAVIAPTRRYGYVESGRNASPERELRHIVQVRDTSYPFLKKAWVPVTEANHRAYGVGAIPMHILIDANGVIRLYQPGRMEEAELEAAIVNLFTP